jgi:hypothetical protein
VDATTGELLELLDINRYAQVLGGVFASSPVIAPETVLPMPFANVSPLGFADSAGWYDYPGGTVSSSLSGRYVGVDDGCGSISKNASTSGRISFDASSGTDCATPGIGGAGNTHAARTVYYHLNRILEVGRGWLPGNAWLNRQLPAHANSDSTCNAYWNGTSVNFFRSGAGCANAGEIATVALHEWGHGLDANDGNGPSPDFGTGETYGDITAALASHESCVATGFLTGGNCGGYGDACLSCTGVRDIDWARHGSGAPHTVANFTQPYCPNGPLYYGPCGREGHCESYVMSEALWDLVARDLPDPGSASAWLAAERLWYLSRATATQGFACNASTPVWTSNGCNVGSLWKTLRAADDDDGNLANGTPHSCHLFAAFDRHGIACGSDSGAATCFSACTPPAAPSLSAALAGRSVQLSWSGSEAGMLYDVFRSESGCGAGVVKIADGLSGASLTDTAVGYGLTYSYRVVARPSGNAACASPPSACQPVVLPPSPCTPPAAPTGLAAVPVSTSRIDLSWNAVPGATEVGIFRAPASGGLSVRIALVPASVTTWSDQGLAEETDYVYTLRAYYDACASSGSAQVQAKTARCTSEVLYFNDFETGAGLSDWTAAGSAGGIADWRGIQDCAAHSGDRIFRFGGASCLEPHRRSVSAYAQPMGNTGLAVPAGSSRTRLSFWHRWEFQQFESASLRAAVDGGSWISVPASSFLTGGTGMFTGYQGSFVNTVVDLDAVCNLATGQALGCAGRVVRIGFDASTDGEEALGWFLDDVQVTVCRSRGCTGEPAAGAASPAGDNQLQVSWSNGAPPSSVFNVYRALGTCAAPGPFTAVARGVSGSSYLDSGLGGGLRYAYTVTGVNAARACESEDSACVEATATGGCSLPFTFAGLSSVKDLGQSTCSLGLSWTAASAPCSGPVAYNVYRSTSPDFTPAPENRIATGLTGTAYGDQGSLATGTDYYYVVRAVDGGGVEDGNTVRRRAEPSGPYSELGTLADNFEEPDGFDTRGWTTGVLAGDANWQWSSLLSQSPIRSWHSPSIAFGDRVLVSPPFGVPDGTTTILTFWHDYDFELANGVCVDGATLEISANGGETWQVLPDSAFIEGGFTGTIQGSGNALQGKRGWCGERVGGMSRVMIYLSAWQGVADARLRWHAAENATVFREGWYIDTVTLANAKIGGICRTELPAALDFYTLPPCRLVDTRQSGAPLSQGSPGVYTLAGSCGIPSTARVLSVNVTAVQPTASGNLTLYPSDTAPPASSTINFQAGVNRANSAMIGLSETGSLSVRASTPGTVHLILDVNGYYEE